MTVDTKQTGEAGGPQEVDTSSRVVSKPALGVVPVAKRGGIYTMTAQEGLNASELLNAAFARKTIGKQTPRRLEVFAPDGPSTGGGKAARQTIRLVPLSGDTGPVMCGFLDSGQKIVELRSYDALVQQYEARFGQACDLAADEYATLCRELQMTLTPFRYTFSQESDHHAGAAQRAALKASSTDSALPGRASMNRFNMMVAGVFVLVALIVALTMFR
ncbi:MAG: hypothetical protein JWN48_4956 [Myxococcaceae bacterium]|nr:hypothetical protein [Myxococcaceae bacterium]